MQTITIKKPEVDSFEMTPFRFAVLEGNSVRWCVRDGSIISKDVAPIVRQSFKEMMPILRKSHPNIPAPFFGDIEIDAPKGRLVEVRFIPKLKP